MWSTAREIADGDVVVVWLTRDAIQPLLIQAGKELNGRFGVYSHSDLIGQPYGSKIGSRNGKGFIHVLRPTPELWTMALPHRTQILYLADIAFITSCLAIRPGSRVIEAGTGSGSFSHSLARTIGRNGHLWTYEFHETRARKAREEFELHGMLDIVTLTQRNVCKEGFTVTDVIDAVFLDLPAPWDAVKHAKSAMRKDCMSRICCFSPCMEQVLRTVTALNETGFTDICMYETLIRPHDVSNVPTPPPISSVTTKLQIADVKREERRQKQIFQARSAKRKRDEEDAGDVSNGSVGAKKAKSDEAGSSEMPMDEDVSVPSIVHTIAQEDDDLAEESSFSATRILQEVRGHTSYLTFACLVPAVSAEQNERNISGGADVISNGANLTTVSASET